MNTIWQTWGEVFNGSLQNLWFGFAAFVPKLLVAIILFVVGWALGSLIAKAFEQVFAALKVDRALKSVGAEDAFRKTGMNLNTGYFVGQVAKWFVVIVFLLASLGLVLGENNDVSAFLRDDVLVYLPRVIIAAIILIIATVLAEGLSKTVSASARAMNLASANLLGAIAKYAVWISALVIALGQLGIAEYYMSALFTALIGMLALGGALAFGLGGRDAAARFINKLGEETRR
jgi:hypothetical protein